MDKNLLLNIFHIPAMSGNESKMREFIKNYLDSYNIEYEEDKKGNVFSLKHKKRPLLSAHMDTVQDDIDENLAQFIDIRENILSGLGVIGADDKNGIYIILEILRETPDINFAFFVEEEVGTVGSKYFMDKRFYDLKDIPYGIVLDRRNAGDIICENNDYGTAAFEKELVRIGENFGYIPSIGTFSDADSLSEEISCANLSVGYYNAHSKKEYCKVSELENSLNYVRSLIENIKGSYEAPTKIYTYKGGYSKGSESYYRDEENYYDNYGIEECSICEKWKSEIIFLKKHNKYICTDCNDEITKEFEKKHFGIKDDEDLDDFEINNLIERM